MKYLCFFALFGCFACGWSSSSEVDADLEGLSTTSPADPAPAAAPKDSASTLVNVPLPEIHKDPGTIAPDMEAKKEQLKKLAKKSEFVKQECCADIIEVSECCCDIVKDTMEKYLKKNDWDAAMAMEGEDKYYPQCARKFKNFEPSIVALQEKYLGE